MTATPLIGKKSGNRYLEMEKMPKCGKRTLYRKAHPKVSWGIRLQKMGKMTKKKGSGSKQRSRESSKRNEKN